MEVQVASHDLKARFPGQYDILGNGLYYNYHRDYDPSLGRYIQSDPIGLNGGLNTYGYVGANPLMGVDPLGLAEFSEKCKAYVDYIAEMFGYDDASQANYHVSSGEMGRQVRAQIAQDVR
ncbi:RHS repeat-associated core domain-containing protein [Umboniibacter marinipuniceus]|uniref:RHS repeat-associated core domain-containing protein n=1 Tax=Umboniibacter marinipuniceus TaxID=569599 RepID=UPI000EF93693|nr:RHS repeat-associated core domain-containing protein [Umboniibacter marinipuniceus]